MNCSVLPEVTYQERARERSEEAVRARTILAEHFCCCCRSINLNICVDFLKNGWNYNQTSLLLAFSVVGTWPR